MSFTEKLKHKYALSDKGAKGMIRAFIAVTLANLVLMLPVGLLYVLSSYLLEGELPRDKFWLFMGAIVGVLLLIALTTLFQYKSTFYSTYVESGVKTKDACGKAQEDTPFILWQERSCRPYEHYHDGLCNDRNRLFALDT